MKVRKKIPQAAKDMEATNCAEKYQNRVAMTQAIVKKYLREPKNQMLMKKERCF